MAERNLHNKPLVEAIVELRWALQKTQQGTFIDPHYKLLPGRLFDRLEKDYSFHEPLQTANIPDELAGHMVQHRFRYKKDDWPLVQIGPGIFSVNETAKYKWRKFKEDVSEAFSKLYEIYPETDELKANSLHLRYIDAVEVDYNNEDIYAYLKDKMGIELSFPNIFFKESNIDSNPLSFNWNSSFRCKKPNGVVSIRFYTGKREKNCLIWETGVHSANQDIPILPDDINNWLEEAHGITHDWFFKLIEGGSGELLRRFENESN